jgi:hypothetical protein
VAEEAIPMPAEFVTADVKSEVALLADTRVRFRHRQTQFSSWQKLIDVDLEIRIALGRPLSAELQAEVGRLTSRLRTLDPH